MSTLDKKRLQVLRTIDKFDKVGRDGVVEMLQKPIEEFGAELDPVQANLVGIFLDLSGQNLDAVKGFLPLAACVRSRVDLMVALDGVSVNDDGTTAWDRLLNMPQNADEAWSSGRRPQNIAWALDDMVSALSAT